jgi:hypothetical protein
MYYKYEKLGSTYILYDKKFNLLKVSYLDKEKELLETSKNTFLESVKNHKNNTVINEKIEKLYEYYTESIKKVEYKKEAANTIQSDFTAFLKELSPLNNNKENQEAIKSLHALIDSTHKSIERNITWHNFAMALGLIRLVLACLLFALCLVTIGIPLTFGGGGIIPAVVGLAVIALTGCCTLLAGAAAVKCAKDFKVMARHEKALEIKKDLVSLIRGDDLVDEEEITKKQTELNT